MAARHRLLAVTFSLATLLYVDRIAISAAKTQVSGDFQLSDTQFGWVLSAFALGYALFQALVLLRMAPWIAANGFAPTWWAFSFGAAALGTLPLRILAQSPSPLIEGLALLLFVAANLVVGALVILTIRSFVGATPRAAAPELS